MEQMESDAVHARRWWTHAVLCLSLVIVVVGNTVLNVAIPTLVRELDASASDLQWIVDAYALTFAGLLLLCGALGDRFGRKRALDVGLCIFAAASLASAWAGSADLLIILRGIMGLGAALIMPATLAILTTVFPPHERAKAIAIWAGLAGAGASIGPLASGFLLEHFWWGSVFLVNLPVIALALAAGRILVPTSKDPVGTPLDPFGSLLSVLALGALLFGIIEAPAHGWGSAGTLTWVGTGVVLLVAFGLWELRSAHPMLDLRFFRNPTFSASCLSISVAFFAMFGLFFVLTQYLQMVLGYGTLEAAVRLLPMSFTMMVAAPLSARLARRYGARRIIGTGLASIATGLIVLSQVGPDAAYLHVVGSLVIMSAGMGISMAPSTTGIMASLPVGKAGVGSAVNDTTRELGGALGVAVLGSVSAAAYADAMRTGPVTAITEPFRSMARSSLGEAARVAADLPGGGQGLLDSARAAYTGAMSDALVIAAVLLAATAVLVTRYYGVDDRADVASGAARPAEGGVHGPLPQPAALALAAQGRDGRHGNGEAGAHLDAGGGRPAPAEGPAAVVTEHVARLDEQRLGGREVEAEGQGDLGG
jgi:EmrB/QacA subfamily drug resistance transporter